MTEKEQIARIVEPLLSWFADNRRPLPFREGRDAYRIWVSEIMLQQTRTAAVIPYFERFMARFPTVYALAAADEDEVNKLWEGLGYYSRARNLLRCARTVVERYGGVLPHTAAELCKLPGIGEYTAGAIASLAYGEPEPAVDGNVLRVLMRVLASERDIADVRVKREVRELLARVYPRGTAAGNLTEAIMELGESVCIPNGAPKCENCPLCKQCRANLMKNASLFPVKSPKKPRRIEERTILLVTDGERFLLRRRPPKGLLAGLYEPLNLEGTLSEPALQEHLGALGYAVSSIAPLTPAVHIFSHVEWHMQTYLVRIGADSPLQEGDLFLGTAEIAASCAIPSAFRHVAAYLKGEATV